MHGNNMQKIKNERTSNDSIAGNGRIMVCFIIQKTTNVGKIYATTFDAVSKFETGCEKKIYRRFSCRLSYKP